MMNIFVNEEILLLDVYIKMLFFLGENIIKSNVNIRGNILFL